MVCKDAPWTILYDALACLALRILGDIYLYLYLAHFTFAVVERKPGSRIFLFRPALYLNYKGESHILGTDGAVWDSYFCSSPALS